MKTFLIFVLFFQCFFALSQPSTISQHSLENYKLPEDVRSGENYYNVLNEYPYYHFKFYKTSNDTLPMSFAMLGYWNKGEGCVIHFTNDILSWTIYFTDLEKYEDYINNPSENNNIFSRV